MKRSPAGSGRHARLALLAFSMLAACGASPRESGAHARPPNVVVILFDTLRADHLGFLGYERDTAPFLGRLAGEAVVFPHAYSSSSWTAPATASLFTGLYVPHHGVEAGFWAHRRDTGEVDASGEPLREVVWEFPQQILPRSIRTLPQHMADAGYRTFGVSSNTNIGRRIGFQRGFEHFEKDRRADAQQLVDQVLGWRAAMAAGEPYFLYMHLNDAHSPYEARAPWYRAVADPLGERIARYDSEIRYLDGAMERLFEEMGWDDGRTLVVLLADHGEEFMEHGSFEHGYSLHNELNRVLMLWSWQGVIEPGVVESNVSLVDVLPTILELCGLEPPAPRDGRSLAPLLRGGEPGGEPGGERAIFAHRKRMQGGHGLWAVILGRWKLIENELNGERLLYDLHDDPLEQHDLLRERADVAADLTERLRAHRADATPLDPTMVRMRHDPEEIEHLEALGYTGDEDE